MYDVYGLIDKLELFSTAMSRSVQAFSVIRYPINKWLESISHSIYRWCIEAMEGLPYYMKICYKAMFNFAHVISFEIQIDQGIDVLTYITKEVYSF